MTVLILEVGGAFLSSAGKAAGGITFAEAAATIAIGGATHGTLDAGLSLASGLYAGKSASDIAVDTSSAFAYGVKDGAINSSLALALSPLAGTFNGVVGEALSPLQGVIG